MQDYLIILLILFVHWIADFVFQSHRIGANKWNNNKLLTDHISTYSLTYLVIGIFAWIFADVSITMVYRFACITFICHWITDYFTSKWTHRLYEEKKYHDFFVVIGFDQFLHALQLILTYTILTQ